jgi:hypothetical protein
MTQSLPTFKSFGGSTWRIRRFADESDKRWSAFNPCISYSPRDGYVVVLRSSNYFIHPELGTGVPTIGSRVMSNCWVANLDDDFQIIDSTMRMIDFSNCGVRFKRGAEDARLFWRDDSWWFVAGLKEDDVYYPRIGLFKLDENYKATLVEIMNDGWLNWVEKNWMPPRAKNPNFDYIYGPTSVYKSGCGVVELREMTPDTKGVRGGGPLWELEDGTYLALIHRAYMEVKEQYNPNTFGKSLQNIRSYTHSFARYNQQGMLIQISPEFIFEHFGIEFGAGLVLSGDDVIVSYGYKDVAAYLGKIKISKVMELLNEC